jgi:hypothetical protein
MVSGNVQKALDVAHKNTRLARDLHNSLDAMESKAGVELNAQEKSELLTTMAKHTIDTNAVITEIS